MKITITSPGFSPHGGIRIILEWANRLKALGHGVTIFSKKPGYPNWFNLNKSIPISYNYISIYECDTLIISSPHDIRVKEKNDKCRKFIFLQMLEHLFQPKNARWQETCSILYSSEIPLISISNWNIEYLKENFPSRGPISYIGNGVNTVDFPILKTEDDGKTVLVEGWQALNPSKDSNKLSQTVAKYLKQRYKCRIIAYGQTGIEDVDGTVDEYYQLPDLKTLNSLYSRASFLLKASWYDARSCSPMEAMTKGTPTLRAIDKGDDDLVNGQNCIRVQYDLDALMDAADRMMEQETRKRLSDNCIKYVEENGWDYWMPIINSILTKEP